MLSSEPTTQTMAVETEPMGVLERAVRMATSGDRVAAHELLRSVVTNEPDNTAAWVWLASVAGDADEILDALRTAHRLAPSHERTVVSLRKRLLRQGVAAAQRGDAERARTLLQECAALDPRDPRVWLWLASTAADRQDAVAYLRRTLEVDPEHRLARATLRQILLHEGAAAAQAGDADRADAHLTEASRLYRKESSSGRRTGGRAPWSQSFADAARLEAEALAEAHAEVAGGDDRSPDAENPAESEPRVTTAEARTLQRVQARASVRTEILPGFDPLTQRVFAFGESSLTPDGRLVMVVDESPAVHAKVAQALERYGHKVLPAVDANDALEKLAEVEPDLILLDVAAAEEDGYRVFRTLRETIGARGVPVILSGAGGVVSRVRGWLAGASDSIAKPFPEGALLSLVDRYAATNYG